jgi:NAD(P)H-flavin reductase
MRETQAIIERVRRVSADLQHLELSVDSSLGQLQPGQSVFAYLSDSTNWESYLREQWVPVSIQPGRLIVEITNGRFYAPGQIVSLLAPLGKPIPLRPGLRQLLMVAQDATPTPLVWLAQNAVHAGIAVTLVLGESALRYPLELLPSEVEILRSDTDWKWPDQVETLNWADQVIALAPSYAQAEVYASLFQTISQLRQQAVPDGAVFGLFYHRLACGTGACQVCQVSCQEGDWLACTDGPAFDLKNVIW